jgi:hypothetical protein
MGLTDSECEICGAVHKGYCWNFGQWPEASICAKALWLRYNRYAPANGAALLLMRNPEQEG